MIVATNLTKSYNNGRVQALRGLSFQIADNDFAVILGASGSGKSTALNIVSGLERPDGGAVLYDGQDICQLSDKQLSKFRKLKVGFVFQRYYLLPHLNVESNVRLGADLVGNKNFREIIEAVGLADKLKRKPFELSGGEQQRVCIARALAKNPQILFLDEPTGALDEQTGRSVLQYIAHLKQQYNFTVLMVTHNQNIAQMANTVINMNSGKVTDVIQNVATKSAFEIGW